MTDAVYVWNEETQIDRIKTGKYINVIMKILTV